VEDHWQHPNTSSQPESFYHQSLAKYSSVPSPYKQEGAKPWSSLQITCPDELSPEERRDQQINELKRTELHSPHTVNLMYPRTNSFRSLSSAAETPVTNSQYFSYLSPEVIHHSAPSSQFQQEFGSPYPKMEAFSPRGQPPSHLSHHLPLRSPTNYQQQQSPMQHPMQQQFGSAAGGGAYHMSLGGAVGTSGSGSFSMTPKSIAYPMSSGPTNFGGPSGFSGGGGSLTRGMSFSISSPMPPMSLGSVGKLPVRSMEPIDGYIYQVIVLA
jgi:hypothetical protein